jgi:hypothetical protein
MLKGTNRPPRGLNTTKREKAMSGRSAFVALALAISLMTPMKGEAQDAGVSGIPRGPGNAGGLNNSANDPSGMGNAAKVAPPPPPSTTPPANPSSFPSAATRTVPQRATLSSRPSRRAAHRRDPSVAAVGENDRLLNQKLKSICRGC